MMQKIKYAIAFLVGAGYASSWWFLATRFNPDSGRMIIPIAIAYVGSLGILAAVTNALLTHWND